MAVALSILGAIMVSGGMITSLIHHRICRRIVRATSSRDDALTFTDTWLNIRQFRKWTKLRRIADQDSDPLLRRDARRALQLDAMAYALFAPGMLLMLVAATFQG
jgi:hypothetical protein